MQWWSRITRVRTVVVLSLMGTAAQAHTVPEGQLTIAFDATIAPSYLDPAEVAGLATPFTFLYALHDAMIKPLPGNNMAPCLAESWTESADGLVYEFQLREGLKFHNGDPFTAEDVKFSFLRYKWPKQQSDKDREIEIVDPYRVRLNLHAPWPELMYYYCTLDTGAELILPK